MNLIISIISLLLFAFTVNYKFDPVTSFMFVNGLISLFFLLESAKSQKISFAFIHWFFIFVFFFFVPYFQYTDAKFKIININTFYDSILLAQQIIFIWILVFVASYYFAFKTRPIKPRVVINYNKVNIKYGTVLLIIIIFTIVTIYFVGTFGITSFLFRGESDNMVWSSINNKSLGLLFIRGFKPFTLSFFIITYLLAYKEKKIENYKIIFPILGFFAILYNLPTGNSRFYAFVVVLIVYVTLFMKPQRRGYWLIPLLFIGIAGGFWLSQFRRLSDIGNVSYDIDLDQLYMGDFDAFEMLTMGVFYVSREGLSLGSNIIGALLFFIPRSIWTNKPSGTGYELVTNYSDKIGLDIFNNNLSFPLIGEFYYAFSFLGIIIAAFIIGYFMGKLDKFYASNYHRTDKEFKIYLIFYSGLIGFTLFIMRGDLINGIAYTTGFVFAFLISLKIYGIKFSLLKY